MSLTQSDLQAIKKLIDEPLAKLEERIISKIDDLTLDVGQFSLETTEKFELLENKLSEKIDTVDRKLTESISVVDRKLSDKLDDLGDRFIETAEMADTNRTEIAKVKRKLGLT